VPKIKLDSCSGGCVHDLVWYAERADHLCHVAFDPHDYVRQYDPGIESVDSQILEMDGGSIELESVDDDAKARFEEVLKR